MRALVTGATGFVGRHLVDLLKSETEWEIVGVSSRAGVEIPGVTTVRCDLVDFAAVQALINEYRPDYIFHLAAQSFVPTSVAAPAETLINNSVAQLNVLEASRLAGIDPVILVVGSAEVYGAVRLDESPIDEEQPFRPTNPYAVSKVTQDMLGWQYYASYGLRVVRVRPFNHIGPGQSERFVVASFARQIADVERGAAEPVIRVGNLETQRDFLDVRDVVRAYLLLARAEPAGEVFNVASGVPRSIKSVLEQLLLLTGAQVDVREDPSRLRPSDTPVVFGNANRLLLRTGWSAHYSLEQSLADTLDYWRKR